MFVFVCVCVLEREREKKKEIDREIERKDEDNGKTSLGCGFESQPATHVLRQDIIPHLPLNCYLAIDGVIINAGPTGRTPQMRIRLLWYSKIIIIS